MKRAKQPSPVVVWVAVALGALGLALLIKALFFPAEVGQAPAVDVERRRGRLARLHKAPQATSPADRAEARGQGVLEGLLLDADGNPVPGGSVTVSRRQSSSGEEPSAPSVGGAVVRGFARTAADGRFRFGELAAAEHLVGALADGHLPVIGQAVLVRGDGPTSISLRLQRGGISLSGRVLDAGGGTVPRARLRLAGTPAGTQVRGRGGGVLQAVADDSGAYRLTLPAGGHQLTVTAGGYAPLAARVTLSRPTVRDFVLAPGARLAGRVLDRSSRRPVGQVEVQAELATRQSAGGRQLRITDSDGRFDFAELEPGSYSLAARRGSLAGVGGEIYLLSAAQTRTDIELLVDAAGSLRGRVLARETSGVLDGLGGARVVASSLDRRAGDRRVLRGRTNDDGSFLLEGMLPGGYSVEAGADGYASARRELTVGAGGVPPGGPGLELVLAPGATLMGQVTGADGLPRSGARLSVQSGNRGADLQRQAVLSVRDGSFTLSVEPGALRVLATTEDGQHAQHGPVQVAPGQRLHVQLKLTRAGSVAGNVRHPDGSPAAGVLVGAHARDVQLPGAPLQTISDEQGRYQLRGLPAGVVAVSADRRGRLVFRSPVDPPHQRTITLLAAEDRSGVDLVVESGGKNIEGQVVGPDGRPLGLVTVTAEKEEAGRSPSPPGAERTFTDQEGRFVLADLDGGNYTLRAGHSDLPDGELRGVAAGAVGVRLILPEPSSVAGVVMDERGQAVTDFTLVALAGAAAGETAEQKRRRLSENLSRLGQRVRDPGGAFLVRRLPAGTHELMVSAADGRAGSTVVTTERGLRRHGVRVVVATGVRAVGRVVEHRGGAPIAGLRMRWLGPVEPAGQLTAMTGADGRFTLEGGPAAATVRVAPVVDPDQYIADSASAPVPAGATTVDVGTLRLLTGSARAAAAPGWGAVGVMIAGSAGIVRVQSVRAGSSAARAGVRPGDQVLSVDGLTVSGLGATSVSHLISGKVGSTVRVEVMSVGAPPRQLEMQRQPR